MRRIVMFNQVSADGYFASPDGGLDWVVPDDRLSQAAMDQGPAYDTVLFGRKTYDMFERFWPHALDEDSSTASDPHVRGRRSQTLRDMAVFLNATRKVVFSRTRKEAAWNNSRLVPELEPRAIEEMKRQPGEDMILFGSGTIVSELTRHGLIDEYQLVVIPVVLGAGRPLFTGVDRLKLELLDVRGFESGNVLQRYRRAK